MSSITASLRWASELPNQSSMITTNFPKYHRNNRYCSWRFKRAKSRWCDIAINYHQKDHRECRRRTDRQEGHLGRKIFDIQKNRLWQHMKEWFCGHLRRHEARLLPPLVRGKWISKAICQTKIGMSWMKSTDSISISCHLCSKAIQTMCNAR